MKISLFLWFDVEEVTLEIRKRRRWPPQKTDYGDRMNKIFKINCRYSVNSVDSVLRSLTVAERCSSENETMPNARRQ